MIEGELPFGQRTAQRLMAIADCPQIVDNSSRLPPHWGTLYELSRLPEEVFEEGLALGSIYPGMIRGDVMLLKLKAAEARLFPAPTSPDQASEIVDEEEAAESPVVEWEDGGTAGDSGLSTLTMIFALEAQLKTTPPKTMFQALKETPDGLGGACEAIRDWMMYAIHAIEHPDSLAA